MTAANGGAFDTSTSSVSLGTANTTLHAGRRASLGRTNNAPRNHRGAAMMVQWKKIEVRRETARVETKDFVLMRTCKTIFMNCLRR